MLQYNTDPYIRYRYLLNDNFKDNCNSKQIEGITVNKEEWTVFSQKMVTLSKFVKTVENEEGILDYECFHLIKGEIYDSSINNYNKLKEGRVPQYKQAVLSTMTRPQLQEICNLLNVESMHKNHAILVREIISKQEKLKKILKNKE